LAVIALTLSPAMAKPKKHPQRVYQDYSEPYYGRPVYGPFEGWNSRNVSDPSFGNRAGINAARSTGRCVADLGYGRYEYCGW
jgi:hypothetical protein